MDIATACRDLSLNARLCMLFTDSDGCPALVFKASRLDGIYLEESLAEYLRQEYGGLIVSHNGHQSRQWSADIVVYWVRRTNQLNVQKSVYTTYGNQAETAFAYGILTLAVDIGKTGERATIVE